MSSRRLLLTSVSLAMGIATHAHAFDFRISSTNLADQPTALSNGGHVVALDCSTELPATTYRPSIYLHAGTSSTLVAQDEPRESHLQCSDVDADVNASGKVVGILGNRAFRHQNGATDFTLHGELTAAASSLDGGNYYYHVTTLVISKNGTVAASLQGDMGRTISLLLKADGTKTLISKNVPEQGYFVKDINDSDTVLLQSFGRYGTAKPAYFKDGQIVGVPAFQDQWSSTAVDMNNAGDFVGRLSSGAPYRYKASTSTLEMLPEYPAVRSSTSEKVLVYAINDAGNMVGVAPDPAINNNQATIFNGGAWVTLRSVTSNPQLSGYRFLNATDINNAGEITVEGEAQGSGGVYYKRGFLLQPAAAPSQMFVRGTFNNWGSLPMVSHGDDYLYAYDIHVDASNTARFKFDAKGDWSENYGDNNIDGVADQNGTDIYFKQGAGKYNITLNRVTKRYTVEKQIENTVKRTVVFIYGQTVSGQDMFLRGGIDWAYAKNNLNRDCAVDKWLCALPITHNNVSMFSGAALAQRSYDKFLDWYGGETGQGSGIEGSPLVWTTNVWPSSWGTKKTVAMDGYGEDPENKWGQHYWKLDVMMDCAKTVNGWFELKSYISNGPGWEINVSQAGAPYASGNHFAKCGAINKFVRNSNEVETITLP
jgi:hypothetical protein